MKISKALRPNRDLPQLEGINLNAAAGVGTGGDYEHAIVVLPNLAQGAPSQTSGMVAQNSMSVRWVTLLFEAILTGAATNNVTFNLLQRRGGNLLVNTTSATTIIAGVQTVTPASMTNIFLNTRLVVSGGTGATETVVVTAITGTTFTATFANGHSGAYTLVSAPLASITFAAGTNAVAYAPIQLAANPGNAILGGDVITIQRVTAGTGLATPAVTVGIDWVTSGPQ